MVAQKNIPYLLDEKWKNICIFVVCLILKKTVLWKKKK